MIKPGETRNPHGRPKGSVSIAETLKSYLARHPDEVAKIVTAMIKQGQIGNMVATKEMLDRIDGRVVETHKIEGELPIKLVFVPAAQILGVEKKEEIIEGESREVPLIEK
jgi:nucleoside permease NupC